MQLRFICGRLSWLWTHFHAVPHAFKFLRPSSLQFCEQFWRSQAAATKGSGPWLQQRDIWGNARSGEDLLPQDAAHAAVRSVQVRALRFPRFPLVAVWQCSERRQVQLQLQCNAVQCNAVCIDVCIMHCCIAACVLSLPPLLAPSAFGAALRPDCTTNATLSCGNALRASMQQLS